MTLAVKEARPVVAPVPATHRARTLDWPLVIGLIGFAVPTLLAVYGPLIAPHDFWYVRALLNGQAPPYPPSAVFPLGSDDAGHDLLSWALIGARATLVVALAAAALRMVIGSFLGILAGWQGGLQEVALARLAVGFSSVPATIAAALGVIAFNVFTAELGFAVALGLVGWGEAFHYARRATRNESAQPFVLSARALGMSEARVVVRHLLPALAPTLVTLMALQISAVLLLMGELGLIRLAMGGLEILDYDPRTGVPTLVAPLQPDWASMLASTRPITSLYGEPWTVLVPAFALLGTVISFNLLADALARRAQRLDIYRLFSARQGAAFALAAALMLLPAALWPSPLADEVAYARAFDGGAGLALASALTDTALGGRTLNSDGARRASDLIAVGWGGDRMAISGSITDVQSARLRFEDRVVDAGEGLRILTSRDANVAGPLLDWDRQTRHSAGSIQNRVLVFSADVASVAEALPGLRGAAAVLLVSREPVALPAGSADALPTAWLSPETFRTLTGTLPFGLDVQAAPFDGRVAELQVTVGLTPISESNVVARVNGTRPEGPIVVVQAPYDVVPYAHYLDVRPEWAQASAIGVMSAAISYVRGHPLTAELMFVATGADASGQAGLRSFLASLAPGERARVVGFVTLGGLRAAPFAVLSQGPGGRSSATNNPADRVAGRLASALGAAHREQNLAVIGPLVTSQISAVSLGIGDSLAGDPAPTPEGMRAGGQLLLSVLAYLAAHARDEAVVP